MYDDDQPGQASKTEAASWKFYFSISFLLFCTLLSGALLPQLTINNVPKVYLPADAPAVVIDDKLRELFPSDQGALLLFEGEALFSNTFLRSLDGLTNSLEAHPRIQKVISVTSQDHIEGTEDGFMVGPLIDIDDMDHLSESERQARVLGDRFANRFLVSEDASALAIVILPSAIDNSLERMALQDDIYALVKQQNLTPYLIAEAGQITTDVEQMRESISQNLRFIPVVVVLGLLMIWLLFKRMLAVLVGAAVITTVVSSTVALFVVFDVAFNLISSILAPLLSALAIAALVHLFNALSYASKRGKRGKERVVSALREIRKPALYNALTTIAGFSSLGLSNIPPIQSLGLLTSAGVGLIYLLVYHLVPHIFIQLDKSDWGNRRVKLGFLDKTVAALFHFGIRRPLWTLSLTILSIALCSPFISNIVVETNLLEFFPATHKTRIATELVQQKLAGTGSLDIVFSSKREESLATPDNLKMIRNFQQWAETQPEVDKTRSFADFVEEMHWGFHAQQNEFRTIPDNASLISQYLFIYDGTDLYDFVDETYQTTRVSLSINIHGASEINPFMARVRDYLANNSSEDVSWEIAGISRMFADQVDLLVKGQLKSMLAALVIIFILMVIQWRSIKDSLICMIPNLSPILLIFILMGAFNIWLDVATAMIASVAVGIAIDDTIHVYHGFIHRVRAGLSPTLAMARTYQQAGRAIMTTTLIICSMFLVLATSNFIPVRNFGLLTSVGLLAALIFDLLLLPAILILIYRPQPLSGPVNNQ